MRRFLRDAAEAFGIAAAAVIIVDVEALIAVGSWEQAAAVGVAIGRAAAVAGVRAVAPRVLAARDRQA